jgi:hypothetical protein
VVYSIWAKFYTQVPEENCWDEPSEHCWDEPGQKCWDEPETKCWDEPTTVKDVQTREECSTDAVKQCKKVMVKICH